LKDSKSFIIALVIVLTISVVLITASVSLGVYNRPLTQEGHNTINQIITALIAIVSMIVGGSTTK